MADCGTMMSEADTSALKDTLRAQQQLLQKLYNELDAERESSATAATEALSVILRLQGEKSAIKMEAEQYKRLSEEKICHAEESLSIIEDVIYQKEMEIAALNHHIQAYRYKLLSMGCVDPDSGDVGFQSIGRRNSAPVALKYKKAINEADCCTGQEPDLIPNVVEKQTGEVVVDLTLDSEKKMNNSASGGISSYMDQIRKLDIRVKEIAGVNQSPSSVSSQVSTGSLCDASNLRNETRSPSPQIDFGNSYDPNKVNIVNETDQTECSVNMLQNGSSNVHDVFEVPQAGQNLRSCKSLMRTENVTAFQGSGSLKREHVVHPEAAKLYDKDKPKWMKNVLESNNCESTLCKRTDVAAMDCHLAVAQPSTSISESRPTVDQHNRTSEIIEVEGPEESTNREEELKLLNEIKEQLNSLHDEITSWKVKKSSTREEPLLCALREAMLYFWL